MNSVLPLNNIQRLLVRSTNWIGDAVMTTPAVRSIRRNFPQATIHLLAKPWVADVFANSPHIDRMLIYDANHRHQGNRGKIRLIRELAQHHYDAVILLQNAFEAALIAFLAHIPIRIGYNTDGRSLLLTHPVRRKAAILTVHQTSYYLNILTGVGLNSGSTELELFINPAERRQAEQLLKQHNAESGFIGVNPGAAYGSAKRWLPDRYIELIRRVIAEFNLPAIIFGGAGEMELGDWIAQRAGQRCLNLCGKTTLRETIALIDRCAAFITNDSGLMHLAAALHKPLAAIFGPTDHITTAPLSPVAAIVRNPASCSPCLKRECPLDHRCMTAITVDMVLDRLRAKLLPQKSSGGKQPGFHAQWFHENSDR